MVFGASIWACADAATLMINAKSAVNKILVFLIVFFPPFCMYAAVRPKDQSYILLPETRRDVKQNQRLAGRIPERQAGSCRAFLLLKPSLFQSFLVLFLPVCIKARGFIIRKEI
jgi:hypothetical protein